MRRKEKYDTELEQYHIKGEMKKGLLAVICGTLLLGFGTGMEVKAQEDIYYTNLNGVEFTEEQYQNVSRVFDEDTISVMAKETADLIKDDKKLHIVDEETRYYRVDEIYDKSEKLLDSWTSVITKAEAERIAKQKDKVIFPGIGVNTYGNSGKTTHSTNAKKVSISIAMGASVSHKVVTVKNKWVKIPKVKSYDVIAIRPRTSSFTINSDTISGYQKWDNNKINYKSNSKNLVIKSNGGVGLSTNIANKVMKSLECQLQVLFFSGANQFSADGTYQHATKKVSLAESKDYKFSGKGYGGVLKFSSSVSPKYDNMKGVRATLKY